MTSGGRARITVVTAPACHLCEDAQAALAELARDHPLTAEVVAADSQTGHALIREHGTGMFPLVLVDGTFFCAGRLPRRKLARLLTRRAAALAGVR